MTSLFQNCNVINSVWLYNVGEILEVNIDDFDYELKIAELIMNDWVFSWKSPVIIISVVEEAFM